MSKQRAQQRAQQQAARERRKRERAATPSKPRTPARKGPAGRPTGELARRSRQRTSLAVAIVLLLQLGAGLLWRDWAANLAVFIVSAAIAVIVLGSLRRRR
ncbi:hypothetical protein [Nocardioides massiliensis]|uniref:SRNA-binding protein n=1 Tax=Nocardioides massiliensis TaxID=1325935 RepID=A0ABT9NTX9_9ACTN|nr:hypothetical protein [Nocardioides massiliensis]MDP9823485.1 sRNA-binding protein [Nocardioides massiliensis]